MAIWAGSFTDAHLLGKGWNKGTAGQMKLKPLVQPKKMIFSKGWILQKEQLCEWSALRKQDDRYRADCCIWDIVYWGTFRHQPL